MKYGFYEPERDSWIGTETGPTLLNEKKLADAFCRALITRFKFKPGQIIVKEYDGSGIKLAPGMIRCHMSFKKAFLKEVSLSE